MSSVERQSCPLHWGHDPTPTKPKRQERRSPSFNPQEASVPCAPMTITGATEQPEPPPGKCVRDRAERA